MATPSRGRIESIDRDKLERRLRQITRRRFPRQVFDRQELTHLVQVVTNEALLLTDLYTGVPVSEILARRLPPFNPVLRGLLEKAAAADEGSRLLFEVKRLPDRIKAVGDKCLFDVGLIGQSEHNGIPLLELGRCSYEMASEILARLAEDQTLHRFFRDNGLRALPLEDEVTFLQQCARRFPVYAEVLRTLRAAGSEARPAESPSSRSTEPEEARAPAAMPLREDSATEVETVRQGGGEALIARFARGRPAPPRERLLLSREELLAAYERILLFSALDIDSLGQALRGIVVQQDPAIQAMCDEFTLYAAGTQNLTRPPSYLFVGPTGVGKNHLVESLIELFETAWGIDIPFLILEGPNYTYPSDINELRGATRGFIRSDEEGILTEFHHRASTAPLSVILVDEVEKAHSQLRKFFLSIMDRGTVTDNRGQVLHFANSMLIYTSNLGYSDLARGTAPIGYGDREAADRRFAQQVQRELRRALAPEFVNRLRVVHFDYLAPAAFDRIFDLELARIARRFEEVHGLGIEVLPAARAEVLRLGTSHDQGARHLRARMESILNVEISRKIRADERRRSGATRMVGYLREIKQGKRPFDLDHVRARVIRQARARVPYRRVIVDFTGGAFEYRGVTE